MEREWAPRSFLLRRRDRVIGGVSTLTPIHGASIGGHDVRGPPKDVAKGCQRRTGPSVAGAKLINMRRLCAVLFGFGVAAVSIALPLWHVTREDSSGCVVHHTYPCDPREVLPYGTLSAVLTYLGIFAILAVLAIIVVFGFAALMRGVLASERQERAARRAAR